MDAKISGNTVKQIRIRLRCPVMEKLSPVDHKQTRQHVKESFTTRNGPDMNIVSSLLLTKRRSKITAGSSLMGLQPHEGL